MPRLRLEFLKQAREKKGLDIFLLFEKMGKLLDAAPQVERLLADRLHPLEIFERLRSEPVLFVHFQKLDEAVKDDHLVGQVVLKDPAQFAQDSFRGRTRR